MTTALLGNVWRWSQGTSAVSEQGRDYQRTDARGKAVIRHSASPSPTLERRLSDALVQSKNAISAAVRDLGSDRAQALRTRLVELLDPDDWEDGDVVLREASMQTMIRATIAVHAPTTGMTLTSSGNLVSTWTTGDRKVRVEALPTGRVSWAIVDRQGDTLVPRNQAADSIVGLQAALEA